MSNTQARGSPGDRFEIRYAESDSTYSVDWNWQPENGAWSMHSKEGHGARWYDDGPLNDAGRQRLLERFDLLTIADLLPLSVISITPPDLLRLVRAALNPQLGECMVVNDHKEQPRAA